MRVRAKLYDGITSKEHIVELEFTPSHLIIEEFDIYVPLKDIKILSRLGNTPRVIELPDNIRCKVEDNDSLDRILEEIDYSLSPIHKFERSWKLAFGSIILIAAFIIFMLTAGADYSAALLAKMLPKDSLDYISKETLVELDKKYLHKSNLSLDKQQQIKELFSKISSKEYRLLFRSSPVIGPNAFALPSGDIVVLDELILLDKDKNYYGVLGVLAHEKAHIVYQHALRGVIKGAIAATIISYITGDISFIATTFPTLLITSKYSREFEEEADRYAKSQLKGINISTKPLADLFEEIENYYKRKYKDNIEIPTWLSTHPDTARRIEFFRRD